MKLFKHNKFYVIVEEEDGIPKSFITFGTTGGYRQCDTIMEASKFQEKVNAFEVKKKDDSFHVYRVKLEAKSGNSLGVLSEQWIWFPIDN